MAARSTVARTWCGYSFRLVSDLAPETDADGQIVELLPRGRYAKASTSRLHAYGAGPFCRLRIPGSLLVAGVYVIADDAGRSLYVGECAQLSERFNMGYGNISPRNCYVGGQNTNCKVNALVLKAARQEKRLQLWFMPTRVATAERKRIEAELVAGLRPPWNGRIG